MKRHQSFFPAMFVIACIMCISNISMFAADPPDNQSFTSNHFFVPNGADHTGLVYDFFASLNASNDDRSDHGLKDDGTGNVSGVIMTSNQEGDNDDGTGDGDNDDGKVSAISNDAGSASTNISDCTVTRSDHGLKDDGTGNVSGVIMTSNQEGDNDDGTGDGDNDDGKVSAISNDAGSALTNISDCTVTRSDQNSFAATSMASNFSSGFAT